jgi:hypothetical protein
MAFDSARSRVVLFGGIDATGRVGDTWEYDGVSWQRRATTGPSPRAFHAMAFDSTRGVTVLFGGESGANTYSGETWTWNGTSWTQRSTGASPVARAYAGMVFDSSRGRAVLYGGYNGTLTGNPNAAIIGDTWEWTGTTWLLRASSGPPQRFSHAMAFDSGRARTVLFGGSGISGQLGDTWEWNGSAWITTVAGPSARDSAAMLYSVADAKCILVGGSGAAGFLNDSWIYTGAWVNGGFVPGLNRYQHAAVYDSARQRMVLFGGADDTTGLLGDTWEGTFNSTTPQITQQPPATQRVVIGGTLRLSVVAQPAQGMTYLWRKNGVPLLDDGRISGAATAALTVNNFAESDAGSYDVTVYNGCAAASTATAVSPCSIILSTPPSTITAPLGGTLTFTLTARTTAPYYLSPGPGLPAIVDPNCNSSDTRLVTRTQTIDPQSGVQTFTWVAPALREYEGVWNFWVEELGGPSPCSSSVFPVTVVITGCSSSPRWEALSPAPDTIMRENPTYVEETGDLVVGPWVWSDDHWVKCGLGFRIVDNGFGTISSSSYLYDYSAGSVLEKRYGYGRRWQGSYGRVQSDDPRLTATYAVVEPGGGGYQYITGWYFGPLQEPPSTSSPWVRLAPVDSSSYVADAFDPHRRLLGAVATLNNKLQVRIYDRNQLLRSSNGPTSSYLAQTLSYHWGQRRFVSGAGFSFSADGDVRAEAWGLFSPGFGGDRWFPRLVSDRYREIVWNVGTTGQLKQITANNTAQSAGLILGFDAQTGFSKISSCVHEVSGDLYCLTFAPGFNASPGLYRWDGQKWFSLGGSLPGDGNTLGGIFFNPQLGSVMAVAITGGNRAQLYRWDAGSWQLWGAPSAPLIGSQERNFQHRAVFDRNRGSVVVFMTRGPTSINASPFSLILRFNGSSWTTPERVVGHVVVAAVHDPVGDRVVTQTRSGETLVFAGSTFPQASTAERAPGAPTITTNFFDTLAYDTTRARVVTVAPDARLLALEGQSWQVVETWTERTSTPDYRTLPIVYSPVTNSLFAWQRTRLDYCTDSANPEGFYYQLLQRRPERPAYFDKPPTIEDYPNAAVTLLRSIVGGVGIKTFKWYRNGVAMVDSARVSGVDLPTLTIRNRTAADDGVYQLVVSPSCGATLSGSVSIGNVVLCKGDLNRDGLVDDADFSNFVVAYDVLDCADASMPPGCPADLNADGLVDDADFSIFVVSYDAVLCP